MGGLIVGKLDNSLSITDPIDFIMCGVQGQVEPTLYDNIVAEAYKSVDMTKASRRSFAAIVHAHLVRTGNIPDGAEAVQRSFEGFLRHQLDDVGFGDGPEDEDADDEEGADIDADFDAGDNPLD